MILKLAMENDTILYLDQEGNPQEPGSSSKAVIYLDLHFCPVISLELPPLKEKDKVLLIERQLPSHFPGSLEGWCRDSLSLGEETRIFLIRQDLLQRLLKDWDNRCILLSPGLFLPRESGPRVYLAAYPGGNDLYFCNQGKLDHALHTDKKLDVKQLTAEFLNQGDQPQILEFPQNGKGLFMQKKAFQPLKLLFLLPLLLALILYFPWHKNQKLAQQLDQLEKEKQSLLQERGSSDSSLPWSQINEILEANQPRDLYHFMEIIYPFFYRRAEIIHLTIQDREFQIQARGKDPLTILEDLKSLPQMENITLYQSREQENREIFQMSGRWK